MCIEDARTKGMLRVTVCSLWKLAVNASGNSAAFRDQDHLYVCQPFSWCMLNLLRNDT